ncbi:MAG: hypothetical protein E6J14_04415 [Chloroflexi bacterium]|nr:MAG: hypothetical protein E6J14_04415 [Chloroflexota bacterium]
MTELTASRVRDDLRALGVLDGMTVMVHPPLRRIGPVAGGADGVIDALDAAVGPGRCRTVGRRVCRRRRRHRRVAERGLLATILQEYLAAGRGTTGRVGKAEWQLLDARDLMDFGVAWMAEHFRPAPPTTSVV